MKKTVSKIVLVLTTVFLIAGITFGIILRNNKINVLNIEESIEYFFVFFNKIGQQ